jgi:hypothetical protein
MMDKPEDTERNTEKQNDEKQKDERLNDRKLRIWFMISIAAAVCGAFMLFPIGQAAADVFFVLIKIGMVAGLILLLKGNRYGFCVWGSCSLGAVVMTIIKWTLAGHASFLFVAAIIVDLLMPSAALRMYGKKNG